ncbi:MULTISPECIES: hypothetical protein [unclassified Methylobacterium]|uniref:hypothetical protein n=1 Tax=unclassified Methylobacterium TaxID=2615210 RepID=UPI0006FB33E6|nr:MULTISPECIES: hypothetical protein [unclassified Methylobacterium]KQO95991.1 hypothetical protein ASF32_17565 [Methylobacterium sp. Leaf91]
MRILRFLVIGSVFGLSILAIGFVSADRLAHLPAAPAPQMVQAPIVSEPQDTGSIPTLLQPGVLSTTGPVAPRPTGAKPASAKPSASSAGKPPVTKTASAKPVPAKPKATDGFDTERLNALLRGDPITPPRR